VEFVPVQRRLTGTKPGHVPEQRIGAESRSKVTWPPRRVMPAVRLMTIRVGGDVDRPLEIFFSYAARGVIKVVDELTESRGALPPSEPLASAAASGAAPPQTRRMAAATDSKLVYCRRCGRTAGERGACTGQYIHHEFAPGFVRDYCARCGMHPGTQTYCTGQYMHHVFTSSASRLVICSRCGMHPGAQTYCTGQYTHHAFVEM
jgi:hypothetical protein